MSTPDRSNQIRQLKREILDALNGGGETERASDSQINLPQVLLPANETVRQRAESSAVAFMKADAEHGAELDRFYPKHRKGDGLALLPDGKLIILERVNTAAGSGIPRAFKNPRPDAWRDAVNATLRSIRLAMTVLFGNQIRTKRPRVKIGRRKDASFSTLAGNYFCFRSNGS